MSKKILYITYDGLTDPLGQSQILPYVQGLAAAGYRFTILSFEKADRFRLQREMIESQVAAAGIEWVPLSFSSRPPLLAKFYDAVRMKRKAVALHKQKGFDMVHCRSYIAADVGLYLKKRFGVKFFFDMRGFWADEKKDGSWNLSNPLYRRIYRYYKQKEADYIGHADQIISLTNAGKSEMQTWSCYNGSQSIEVIPCCADMDLFSLTDTGQKSEARRSLDLPEDAMVVSYLGSIGTWYMLDEMLQFFRQLKENYPNAKFLFLTHSSRDQVLEKINAAGLSASDFIIREASRKQVPFFMKASDLSISFIKPVYSKISSSPTKLAEVLAMGIPVICNSGIGDVKEIVTSADAGYVIHDFSKEEFLKAINAIPHLLMKPPATIRRAVEESHSLSRGVGLYRDCYSKVLS
ncbi:MAG TPA: glycosyltransferase [Flavisolibacter sp.]